jgi:DNA-cytosine methyltransferase
MLTVGSTFTGVGGADLGLEWAGFRIAWQCELDPWKRSILASHWPDTPIHDDITTLHDPEPVDVMIGGFPCQDLSVAGKRKGFDGERSVLAFEFLRVAESLSPRWLILENVPGLLSSNRGRDFARLVDEVVACGYGVSWRVLDARYFGVPQRRRRVFLVARRADALIDSGAASRLALRALLESGSGDPTPGWPPRQDTPADAGGSPPSGRIVGSHGDADAGPTGTLTRMYSEQSGQDFGGGAGVVSFYSTGGSQSGFARGDGVSPTIKRGSTLDIASPPAVCFRKSKRAQSDQDDETWVESDSTNTLNRFDTGDTRATQIITAFAQNQREEVRDLGEQSGALTGQGTHQQTFIASALDRQAGGPDDNSAQANHLVPQTTHTLTSVGADASEDGSGRGTPLVSEQTTVRRLTPMECERLMGWPDGWTAPEGVKAPDSKRYAACGDGIVSWVAYWIGQRIRMIEEEA